MTLDGFRAGPSAVDRIRGLRLVRSGAGARSPKLTSGLDPTPPLGLRAFDDEASDVAVLLDIDRAATERAQVDTAAAQIPLAREQPKGRVVVVLPEHAAPGGIFTRLFRGGRAPIPRAVRATALLARGYAEIGAAIDTKTDLDLVWGVA